MCYECVLKQLSPYLWNWKPAVQWYFPLRWVFSVYTLLHHYWEHSSLVNESTLFIARPWWGWPTSPRLPISRVRPPLPGGPGRWAVRVEGSEVQPDGGDQYLDEGSWLQSPAQPAAASNPSEEWNHRWQVKTGLNRFDESGPSSQFLNRLKLEVAFKC